MVWVMTKYSTGQTDDILLSLSCTLCTVTMNIKPTEHMRVALSLWACWHADVSVRLKASAVPHRAAGCRLLP